jgi:hypothetical protein
MAEPTLEQVARLAEQLSPADKLDLIKQLERQLQQHPWGSIPPNSPDFAGRLQSLRGAWRDHFPEDLDLDTALREMREEWEKEWQEATEG